MAVRISQARYSISFDTSVLTYTIISTYMCITLSWLVVLFEPSMHFPHCCLAKVDEHDPYGEKIDGAVRGWRKETYMIS